MSNRIDLVELGVVKVRHATPKDAKAVRKLFVDAPFVGGGDTSGYHMDDVLATIRRDFFIVAQCNDEVIGALWDIKYPRSLIGGACAVRPDYDGCGVYRGMSEFRWKWAKKNGVQVLISSTVAGNRRMETLFRRHGYTRCSSLVSFTKEVK